MSEEQVPELDAPRARVRLVLLSKEKLKTVTLRVWALLGSLGVVGGLVWTVLTMRVPTLSFFGMAGWNPVVWRVMLPASAVGVSLVWIAEKPGTLPSVMLSIARIVGAAAFGFWAVVLAYDWLTFREVRWDYSLVFPQ